jgi:hypothetical protein
LRRRIHPLAAIFGVLAAIGLIAKLLEGSAEIILAVIVFGGVFLLWKYPPSSWRKPSPRKPDTAQSRIRQKTKRKQVPFRVIQGNKRDDNDSDRPMYH